MKKLNELKESFVKWYQHPDSDILFGVVCISLAFILGSLIL